MSQSQLLKVVFLAVYLSKMINKSRLKRLETLVLSRQHKNNFRDLISDEERALIEKAFEGIDPADSFLLEEEAKQILSNPKYAN